MYNGWVQIHPTHKLWYQMWGQSPWDAVSMCPKTVSRCPKSVSKCPESVSRRPHFFQAHILLQQLQALATGICSIQIVLLVRPTWCLKVPPCGVSRCPSTGYIETLFWKSVLLKYVRLHISENFHLLLKYTPLDAVSVCVVKIFYFEN